MNMGWLLINHYLFNLTHVDDLEVITTKGVKIKLSSSSWVTFNGLDEDEVISIKKQYVSLKKKHFFKSGKFEAILEERSPATKISVDHIERIAFFYYSLYNSQLTAIYKNGLVLIINDTPNKLPELASVLNSYLSDKADCLRINDIIDKDFFRPSIFNSLKKLLKRYLNVFIRKR